MRKATLLVFIMLAALESEALSLKRYLEIRDSIDKTVQDFIYSYIAGLGEGLAMGNSRAEFLHGIHLYCPPEKLAFYPKSYKDILDTSIERRKDDFVVQIGYDRQILGFLLLQGLEDTFPCSKK